MKNVLITALTLSLLLSSCGSKKRSAGDDALKSEKNMRSFELVEAWRTDTLLRVPESVLYDKDNDIIYVSNLNYEPRIKDGNGFISRLNTDGEILDLHWVDGMSSPKGLGLYNGKLYVSDIDEVIVIDIAKAEIIDRIHIEGAKMINDIAIDGEGNVYVSDTDGNFIYLISNGVVSKWLGEGLNAPNGLLVDGNRLLLASIGSHDFSSIDLASHEINVISDSIGRGDGIAWTGIHGYFLVTDWSGRIFMVYPDGSKTTLLDTRSSEIGTADIDYIPEKKLLLVPTFFKHAVVAYKLVETD